MDTAIPSPPEADAQPRTAVDDAAPAAEAAVAKPRLMARLKSLFSRRRVEVGAVADAEVDAEPDHLMASKPKQKRRATDLAQQPEIREAPPSIFSRLSQYLRFRRKTVEALVELETNDIGEGPPQKKSRARDDPEAAETPEPKLAFFARLKRRFRFRRHSVANEIEANENDKTLVIEKTKLKSAATEAEEEVEAPAPNRLKRLLLRLRNKWVWIPAVSLATVGIISWGVVVMLHTTHEKERLQAELKATKKMLEKKTVATVSPIPAAPAKLDPATHEPGKPEKKVDPAFQIIGHAPVKKMDELSIDASDCVVKDKKSVAENLKACITGFNQAMASAPEKTKNP